MIYRGVIPFPVSLYSHLIHHHRSSPFAFSTFIFSVSFLCSCSSYFSCFTARNVHYNVLLNSQSSLSSASHFHFGSLCCKESTSLFRSIFHFSQNYLSSSFRRRHCCGKTVLMHRGDTCRCCMYRVIDCMTRSQHPCGRCRVFIVAISRHSGCTPF